MTLLVGKYVVEKSIYAKQIEKMDRSDIIISSNSNFALE